MKLCTLALTAASAGIALAQPHKHAHLHQRAHQVKRDVTVTSNVPGPTEYLYVLNGQAIPISEVCQGVDDGSLTWADGNAPPGLDCDTTAAASSSAWATSTTAASTTPSTTPSTTAATTSSYAASSVSAGEFYQWSSHGGWSSNAWSAPSSSPASSAAATSAPAWSPAAASSAAAWSSAPAAPSASSSSSLSGGTGLTAAFPDGQLDCSTFPSDYGAVNIDYLGLGGWIGLQAVTISGNAVSNIVTGVSGQTCVEGMMCSYACPPGYQKSQWPSTQGASGQSVGGISCQNGKLHLTNPSLSSSLCMPGVGGVQATNNAGGVVSICRTDYPGTESETVPVELQPGSTEELACPDAANYYTWEGASTSAQYYLNPIGYGASQACQWGSAGTPLGNFAPMNFGVGAKSGTTWLSMFSNEPTTSATFAGTVELQGNLSGSCKYSNGQYCSSTGCNAQGCTVSIISGTATFVISS